MSRALVTGASVGLGRTFAQRLAEAGWDLVLVARNTAKLEEVAAELRRYAVEVDVLTADLADDQELGKVESRLAEDAAPIDMLVNNAGYSIKRSFLRSTLEAEDTMLKVLVRAPLRLSHVAVRGMVARGRGIVVNVSSVAGFVPQSTYNAAKAYLTTFTESMATDLRGTGVQVMALCPGYVHTEFHDRAGVDKRKIPGPLWLDTDHVVDAALRDLARGVLVSVPSVRWKVITALSRHSPRAAVTAVSSRLGRGH